MAFTQAQIDALTLAISSGVLKVEYAGRLTMYQSTSQMIALRDRMQRELAGGSTPVRPLAGFVAFSRGDN